MHCQLAEFFYADVDSVLRSAGVRQDDTGEGTRTQRSWSSHLYRRLAGRSGIAHANETFHDKLQNRLYLLALDLLAKNVDVILEDGLWTRSERISKLADARRLNTRVELHFFDLTFEDLWLRLRDRNETALANSVSITREALASYWRVFQRPDRMELDLFDHTTVHT